MMIDAVAIMAGRKISELPVVDADGRPVGLIDITDVVALLPEGNLALQAAPAAKSSAVPPPKSPAFTKRSPQHPRQSDPRGDNS